MLLVGGIAAALVYPVLESDHPPMTEVKYYTVLPRAVPAAPPPELLYVDKWRIVAIDPFRLAEAAKTEQPETVEPVKAETKAVALFAPALPIAPPPEIIMIERGDTKQPERKRPVAEKRPPPSSGLKASVSAGPKKPENTGDVLEQIDRWFAGANKR